MNTPNARARILSAATKVFAQKSFDGSRIDDIAKEANVPKSLIYYHFKSKDEILEVLTSAFINEFISLSDEGPGETHQAKAQKLPERMKNIYYEFGMRNADLVRVILIDSLKKTKEQHVLFKIIEAMIDKDKKDSTDEEYDVQERRIAEFFTSFLPNCAYILFAEAWTNYFKIERSSFDKIYMKIYQETHAAYHKNHGKANKN